MTRSPPAASDADSSAGFAYHLRQIDDQFVRQRPDERYELTAAGRAVTRSLRTGEYTGGVDHDPIPLDDPCPFCGADGLAATILDSIATVACEMCETTLLRLRFPPRGDEGHNDESIPATLDRYHRHRIQTFAGGHCPDCGASSTPSVELTASEENEENDRDRAQLSFDCECCGASIRCPPTLTVLDHPAVVSFYRDHGEAIGERPLWNVGSEWREHVVSREPWCLVVSTRLADDVLELYLAGDGTVVDTRQRTVTSSEQPSSTGGTDETPSSDDATA